MITGLYSIISGLCLLLVFVLYVRMVTSVVRSEKRDIYVGIMIIGMLYLFTDMLWGVIYDNLIPIPVELQRIIYAVYYSGSAVLSYRWFLYVEYMQESVFYKNKAFRTLSKLPMMFVVVVAVLSIWTGWFFYIDEAGIYCRGPLYVPQLIFTYGYILFAAIKLTFRMFATKDFESQNTYMIMLSYFVFPVVFGVLQITNQDMPFLCIGIALATLQTYLFYVTFERERELSVSKIHSLSRLFISSYFVDLRTGKREYLSKADETADEYLTGDFYKRVPDGYEDAIRSYVEEYVHSDDRQTYLSMCERKYMEQHLSVGNQFYFFNYRQKAAGKEKWYRMHVIASSFQNSGEVATVVMAVMDVDEQVRKDIRQKEVVEEALVEAEEANRAKSNFLSNMSHDIRTPMNAILGFTLLAQEHVEEKEEVQGYLEKISSAGKHLLSLINDILDMSRIESGKISIQEDEVSLRDVIQEVRNLIQPMAEAQAQNFDIHVDITNNYVFCDKLRLNQVLINLLGNAIKFTPAKGNISLDIRQEMVAPPGYGVYIFRVKDTGIGIAPEFHDKIFEAFEREKATEQSGIQGTGLGLAITKNIVRLMGGKISVESELGKGTEFIVKVVFLLQDVADDEGLQEEQRMQIEAQERAQEEKERRALFTNRKLLLVEDNELNRQIARILLKEQGFILEEAVNGQEAVERIKASKEGEFDFILMDIQMPVMNGYEATKEIRALPNRILANIPILAMTANAFDEEKKKALSCGMNGHITKPIDVNILFKTIEGILK